MGDVTGDSGGIEARFRAIAADFGPAIQRLARGYEIDAARQQDLAQDILLAIWRALPSFEERASLRTWVFRVAHNVAVTHVVRGKRDRLARSVPIDDAAVVRDAAREAEGRDAVDRLAALVRALRPADAQIILLYLEGLEYAEIAEVTGLTRENVGVKVHRIKAALARGLDDASARSEARSAPDGASHEAKGGAR
jgi:RNA polymerase sigma-70 factor (ECF subfamily)